MPRVLACFGVWTGGGPTVDAGDGIDTLHAGRSLVKWSARPQGLSPPRPESWIITMRLARLIRPLAMLAGGATLLQIGSCTNTNVFDFVQTLLLGVTAAGAMVIIREV